MRILTLAILAGGLALTACSNETEDDVVVADNGVVMMTPGNGTDANLMMGDPAAAVATAETNRVFFALDSADLTDAGRAQLDQIANAYSQMPGAGITLAGFTDTTGTRPYNEMLSGQRADAVRAYLVEKGIATGEIETEARGQEGLRVDTENNVAEPANRRVRIEFGDQM